MAVRSTMADLIARVRQLIGDPNPPASGQTMQFQDQDVQDVLDMGRVNVRNALLRPTVTLTTSGVLDYEDYYADMGNWEADVTIQDGHFNVVTDYASADYLTGHWNWNLASPGKIPPLFITGKYYDIYGAAADLLERWAAVWLRSYDFTSDGQSFKRSQAAQAMLTLAQQYRKQSLVHTIPMVRDDLTDDSSSTNVVVGNTDVMGW
jgi:hypothetical protein